MSEGELDRLRRALERLMNGQREALGVIYQEVEDQEPVAQKTLAEVQDILTGGGRWRCRTRPPGRGRAAANR